METQQVMAQYYFTILRVSKIVTVTSPLLTRFFFGKNKVMMIALGKGETDEYKDNLHKVILMQDINLCSFEDKDSQRYCFLFLAGLKASTRRSGRTIHK